MGNRAVITTNRALTDLGLYVHWHGGKDSVEGFLTYCRLKKYPSPEIDCYGWAYLAGVVSNFFGNGYSCGLDRADRLDCDNWDNGVYIINNWRIIDRLYFEGREQNEYNLREFLKYLDERQPEHMRLTEKEWEEFDKEESEK